MTDAVETNEAAYSPVLYKFTNATEAPHLDNLLAMFYQGSFDNKLGIMDSFNLDSEEVETILVGVDVDKDGKPVCYPLAKLLRAEDTSRYLSPDGIGGYFDPLDPTAAAEARKGMKTIKEATIE